MSASIYRFILKCQDLWTILTLFLGELHIVFSVEEVIHQQSFFSLLRIGIFCIYLVKQTLVVVNQGSVILPFLMELPAKIHSMDCLPVFPLHFAEEKLNREKPVSPQH